MLPAYLKCVCLCQVQPTENRSKATILLQTIQTQSSENLLAKMENLPAY